MIIDHFNISFNNIFLNKISIYLFFFIVKNHFPENMISLFAEGKKKDINTEIFNFGTV